MELYNLDAEKLILGSLLQDHRLCKDAVETMPVDAVYLTAHRVIFQAISDMVMVGQHIDIVTLSSYLRSIGQLEAVGAEPYLSELIEQVASVGTPSALKAHCQIVVSLYARREISRGACDLQKLATSEGADLDALVAKAELVYDRAALDASKAGVLKAKRGRIVLPSECADKLEEFRLRGAKNSGVDPGFGDSFRQLYRPAPGTLTVVTGIPHHGKSTWLDQLMVQVSELHQWGWAIYSPEALSEGMSHEMHIAAIIEKKVQKSFETSVIKPECDRALQWVDQHFTFLEPDEDNATLSHLMKLVVQAISERNIKAFVFDPWNRIHVDLDRNEDEKRYLFRALGSLHRFCKRHGVAGYVVAHPTKMEREHKTGMYRVPTLYDIYGGSAWYDMVDNGICVYRHMAGDFRGKTQVHVQKVKFKWHGRIGDHYFQYIKDTASFKDDEGSWEDAPPPKAVQQKLL